MRRYMMVIKNAITKERLDSIKDKLKVAERPVKKRFSKKEALEEMLVEISYLRKKKLSFIEIAQVISECSEGDIKPKSSEIQELIEKDKLANKAKKTKTPSPSSVTSYESGDINEESEEKIIV